MFFLLSRTTNDFERIRQYKLCNIRLNHTTTHYMVIIRRRYVYEWRVYGKNESMIYLRLGLCTRNPTARTSRRRNRAQLTDEATDADRCERVPRKRPNSGGGGLPSADRQTFGRGLDSDPRIRIAYGQRVVVVPL